MGRSGGFKRDSQIGVPKPDFEEECSGLPQETPKVKKRGKKPPRRGAEVRDGQKKNIILCERRLRGAGEKRREEKRVKKEAASKATSAGTAVFCACV